MSAARQISSLLFVRLKMHMFRNCVFRSMYPVAELQAHKYKIT
jgi:hypothetical protein